METILAFIMIFLIGSVSIIGLSLISLKENQLDKTLFYLVAVATGTIFATAIFDLIPESIHHVEELIDEGAEITETAPFYIVMAGFVVFFILERFIYWFHGHTHREENKYVCHGNIPEIEKGKNENKIQNFAVLNLVGDGIHNFLDGIIIMVAFSNNIATGIIITLAVLVHELPQEVGDFGILIYGGFTKRNAILANFLTGMIALLGGLFAFLMSDVVEGFNMFFLAFSGGGFIYLACTELMPEILKEKDLKKSIIQTMMIFLGIALIIILMIVLPHAD